MREIIHFPSFFIAIIVASIISGIISYFADFNFWILFVIILAAMFLNSILAEKEDNAPGGFYNPDSENKEKPE